MLTRIVLGLAGLLAGCAASNLFRKGSSSSEPIPGRMTEDDALMVFRRRKDLLRPGWDKDGYLDVGELDEKFDSALPALRRDVAYLFGCRTDNREEVSLDQIKECVAEKPMPPPFTTINYASNLRRSLDRADRSKPVAIVVWSSRMCPHCIDAKPSIVAKARELEDRATFLSADVAPENEGTQFVVGRYKISRMPSLVILRFKDGEWQADGRGALTGNIAALMDENL